MKIFSSKVFALALLTTSFHSVARADSANFNDVWSTVEEGPYAELPQHRTTFSSFFSHGADLLTHSVVRTLSDNADILPSFQKLVHPIGICFAGTWSITSQTGYSGYYANGSQGKIIVRASEAMGNGNQGGYRAFGLAGKIFPSTDGGATVEKTANFFTIDDLGGTLANSFLDDAKTNEPKTSVHFSQLAIFPTLTHIAKTFSLADSNPGIRQVYEISELGLGNAADAKTPHWMALKSENSERVDASDFRDELRLANYPAGLNFGIYVADNDGAGFRRVGQIHLDQEALSSGCDHRLHFHHPRAK